MEKHGLIVITGFKGCGKTTIGSKLARRLGVEFVDTDKIIEKLNLEETGGSLDFRSIYKYYGQQYFNNLESKAVKMAFARSSGVISLGGGSINKIDTAPVDPDALKIIYVKVDPDTLYERIMKNGTPAFFDEDNPRASFDKLYAQRRPAYESLATITVDNTDEHEADAAVDRIVEALQEKRTI